MQRDDETADGGDTADGGTEACEPLQSGRRHGRLSVELEITMDSDHNFYAGLLENVSASGVFVATHALTRLGERVPFSIRFAESEEPVSGVGEVRWIRQYSETSDAPPGMGLQFVDVAEESRQRIAEFLRGRAPLLFDDESSG